MSNAVLRLHDVSVAFGFDKNGNSRDGVLPLQVTDRVSFDIYPGEFFALVGESGCGKSVTAMSILRLLPWPSAKIVNGSILFNAGETSRDLVKLSLAELQQVRGSEIACKRSIQSSPSKSNSSRFSSSQSLANRWTLRSPQMRIPQIHSLQMRIPQRDVIPDLKSLPRTCSGGNLL